ncbi:PHO23 protein, partial [Acromyrmex insinuator]
MEDEDGESKIDMWNILDKQRLNDSTLDNPLKHSIDDVYTAVIEEEKQLIRYNSILTNDSSGKNIVAGPNFVFKGFKKRILAEAREVPTVASKNSTSELRQLKHFNARTGKDKKVERKRKRKITEYAQYLGLRPSSKYKCSKCHAWSGYGPNSRQNSCACNPNMTPMPSTSESNASVSHASNFKITRKVYLCSACGTYFENWNLFLHMRDTHKRHICLYCLGMFGQAERLSYHLMKKHSVPEMAFSSVEDFYNSFKGSCYLICCSCEKVFSETDNFFNHFCSPVLEQDPTVTVASICTICRQSGTHASTCNFTLSLDTDKEVCSTSTPLAVADATYTDNSSPTMVPSSEIVTNLGGKGLPRKAIKYNRRKRERDGMQNSRQQKSSTLMKKLSAKVQCNETQLDCDLDVQKEIANNLPRDTVTETIMEVSRYTGGNSSDENDENDEQAVNKDVHNNRDKGSGGKSPVQNCQLDFSEPYDSVTETIMEVSRYTGEEVKNEKEDVTYIPNACASHTIEKVNTEDEGICDKSDVDPTRSASSRTPSPAQFDTEEITTVDTKANNMCETGTKYDSPQDARSCSPFSRSLFSPQHESHISDPQSKEIESFEDNDKKVKKPVATNATESQASVSFNAVASSDRSLVIKICNRNSQFSVATTTVTSRESEENNNAEGSTSKERMPNGSEIGRDIIDNDQANELDDSDSDSDKLAVVDSNPEEDEEAEDGEEGEADETEERHNEMEDKNQRNQEENEHTKSHTIDNGIVLAGEDVPCIDLNVEGTLDSMELEDLLKRCIEAASPICVYCNHSRYIAVNGRQLGLHMLAEHKFQPQHPAIIIHAEQFIARVKRSLDELESRYFNLDTYNSADGTYNVPNVLIYECFHCRFHSTVHKELYLHNRKMHQKTILICIMCKSTFYSYSELVCHLCPGVYSPNVNLRYRCCLCGERGGKRNAITTATVESIKLNIPKALYQKNPGFVASSQSTLVMHPNSRSSTPNLLPAATCNDFHSGNVTSIAIEMQQQQASTTAVIGASNQNVGDNGVGGMETENKRVSKRKRVPKRFYGDSSDDEPQEKQSFSRWRKIETTTSTIATTIPAFTPLPPMTTITPTNPKPLVSRLSLSGKTIQTYSNRSAQVEQAASQQQTALPEASPIVAATSATESEGPAESSSDSSESEPENIVNQSKINQPTILPVSAPTTERPGKIYCYCQCPYDEVSEMIACDGEDCRIEWFHFECVGIMVPPKGRWYCPDCRKKHGIVQNDEYCD